MADEYFYAVTLDAENPIAEWEPEEMLHDYRRTHKLVIKQMLLGHNAKEDEYHVVEASTYSMNEGIKLPIAVLKAGESRSIRPDLEFPELMVTFTLIEGSGPVHIHGTHILMPIEEDFSDEEHGGDDGTDEEEPSSRPKHVKTDGKAFVVKPKTAENNGKAKKK